MGAELDAGGLGLACGSRDVCRVAAQELRVGGHQGGRREGPSVGERGRRKAWSVAGVMSSTWLSLFLFLFFFSFFVYCLSNVSRITPGLTALHQASANDRHILTVLFLLEHGAAVNAKAVRGFFLITFWLFFLSGSSSTSIQLTPFVFPTTNSERCKAIQSV